MAHSASHRNSCDTTFLVKALRQAKRFVSGENGVTAIEYALLASLIAIVALGGIATLGAQLGVTWTHVATEVGKVT